MGALLHVVLLLWRLIAGRGRTAAPGTPGSELSRLSSAIQKLFAERMRQGGGQSYATIDIRKTANPDALVVVISSSASDPSLGAGSRAAWRFWVDPATGHLVAAGVKDRRDHPHGDESDVPMEQHSFPDLSACVAALPTLIWGREIAAASRVA